MQGYFQSFFLQKTIFLLVDFSLGHYDISMKLCSSIYCFERKTIVAKNAVQNISVKKYLQELIAKRIVYLHISRSFMIFTWKFFKFDDIPLSYTWKAKMIQLQLRKIICILKIIQVMMFWEGIVKRIMRTIYNLC